MADEQEFKIKGAAAQMDEAKAATTDSDSTGQQQVTDRIAGEQTTDSEPKNRCKQVIDLTAGDAIADSELVSYKQVVGPTNNSEPEIRYKTRYLKVIDLTAEDPAEYSDPTCDTTNGPAGEDSEGEKKNSEKPTESHEELLGRYRWTKCSLDPPQYGQEHYYLHMDTNQSQWEEPAEPYWLWDTTNGQVDQVAGLQNLKVATTSAATTEGPDDAYQGYNPKIHGAYDPTAPYAQYHNRKREEEARAAQIASGQLQPDGNAYVAQGTFNRFTGGFQSADRSAEHHNDYNKSGRQMGAFFDVDAAANSHNGKSLKEERRNQKLSKKEIRELADKRKAKKEKKRLDFYRS